MHKGATVQSANQNYGRQGTKDYLEYGYVPSTIMSRSTIHWIMPTVILYQPSS